MKKFLVSAVTGLVALVAIAASPFGGNTAVEATGCNARTTTVVSVPYGGSASRNDLVTTKVINQGPECGAATVTVYPRVGTQFGSIVTTTGGWLCTAPATPTDPTVCTNDLIAANSSHTIRVQYNRPYPNAPVSGSAYATITLN